MNKKKNPDEKPTINITKDYSIEFEPVAKNAFAQFIRDKRKEYNEDNGEEITTKDLGTMLGINYEMFRKILNQEKPTKKRDCIIAICVALQLLPGEIDEALGLYQYMPALDKYNPRDGFIIAQITGNNGITVKELNNRLMQRGFPGLDIQDKRGGKTKSGDSVPVDLPFKVMKMRVRTPIDADYYYGDPYNSLCTTYDPSHYRSTGDMILGDPRRKKYIQLTATTDGYRSAKVIKDEPMSTPFESLDETGDYKNYFIELENAISIEKHRLLDILNDTRNYQKRTSAIFSDDSICIFTEQFNNVIPEMNEYYILTLSAGHYKLYVYDQSAFMFWYLSKESYSSYFGNNYPEPKETFESIEELEALISASKNSDESIHFHIRRNAFRRLMPDVDDLYQKIKEGKGGRSRFAPIIGPHRDEIIARFKDHRPDEKVWVHVSTAADIHSYRADYATRMYRMHAREYDDIPYDKINPKTGIKYKSEVYYCRGDEKGRRLDRKAMLIASKALGHNRVDVIAGHYLRGLQIWR